MHDGIPKSRSRPIGAVIAALICLAPVSAWGRTIVISATGPIVGHFVRGAVLPDTWGVDLRDGQQLTLLDADGTRVIKGPGHFDARPVSEAARSLLERFLASGPPRPRAAGVRGRGLADVNLWAVNIDANGVACVLPGQEPELWRSTTSTALTVALHSDEHPAPAHAEFSVGKATTEWPDGVAIVDRQRYTVVDDQGQPQSTIELRIIAPPVDLAGLAREMVAAGCVEQLALLRQAT